MTETTQRMPSPFDAMCDAANSFANTIEEATRPLRAQLEGWPIEESRECEPGTVIYAKRDALPGYPAGVVVMHPRDAVRLRYPRGLQGTIDASLEWQRQEINRRAAAAIRRLDAMYVEVDRG